MGLFNKHVMLLVLVIALWEAPIVFGRTQEESLGHEDETDGWGVSIRKTTVGVCNELGEGLNFTIHCKSKDNDLGTHEISYQTCYQWKFHNNFWGTTLFFCNVKWRDGEGTWDLYNAKRDMKRCPGFCVWDAKTDGLHAYKGKYDIVYSWSKPPN